MTTNLLPEPTRQPLNLPAGSVRSLLVLMIVLTACVIILLAPATNPKPLPPYLLYLLLLALGAFFAGHGHSYSRKGSDDPSPLHLPRGTIPVLVVAALIATVVYKVTQAREAWDELFQVSIDRIKLEPLLPVIIIGGFFLGLIARAIFGRNPRAFWAQDLQAWIALVALVLMTVDVLLQLVINVSLREVQLDLSKWEAFLAGVVAFYFGARS